MPEETSVFDELKSRLVFTVEDLKRAYYAGYEEGIVPAFDLWLAEYIRGK